MGMDYRWEAIDALEVEEKYAEALTLMVIEWEKHPEDLKVVIRLGFLCWYLIVEAGVLGGDGLDAHGIIECEKLFSELVHFGQATFPDDREFLWTFGYMISLFPEFFDLSALIASGNYGEDPHEAGNKMIEKAHILHPEDEIIQLIYLYNSPGLMKSQEYKELCEEVAVQLPFKFQGKGEMQQYFKVVLNRTNFDSD